jgi:membrane fusion protein, copper/silver efflux system
MKTFLMVLIILAVGIGAGVYVAPKLGLSMGHAMNHSMDTASNSTSDKSDNEPLYWVAPMDPNYQRDQPGQSPMGMDLIPVYKNTNNDNGEGPGTITIDSAVLNNLGVRTAAVENRVLQQTINTVGYVQFNQDDIVHIHPRVEGWVEKLYIKAEGEPVKKGQALYDLYSPQLVTAQEELLIASSRNSAYLISAAKDRLKALQLSESFIKRLIKERKIRQTVTFYSPQSGVVNDLSIREGFFVKPGTTMMSIGSLDEVWVEAEIFERQARLITVGMPVEMNVDYQTSQQWQGTIDYIYPSLDAKTRTLRVRLRFINTDNSLKPNMFTRIRIDATNTTSDETLLMVPAEAVIRTGIQNRVVLSLGEGKFKSVAVTLGQHGDQWIEIVDGINAQDTVVTSAQFLLDSESSKTSDFMRMQSSEKKAQSSVWAAAQVIEVMADTRMLKLDHEPISEWSWPAMTMQFSVGEDIDISSLHKQQKLHIEISDQGGNQFLVTKIHIPDQSAPVNNGIVEEEIVKEEMDHSKMDHGTMNDQAMDHSKMDHGTMNDQEMDHSEMDHSQHSSPSDSSTDDVDHSTMKHHQ